MLKTDTSDGLTFQDWQASGAEKAEAHDYSGALKLWNRALTLSPNQAALHEMKSQACLLAQNLIVTETCSKMLLLMHNMQLSSVLDSTLCFIGGKRNN